MHSERNSEAQLVADGLKAKAFTGGLAQPSQLGLCRAECHNRLGLRPRLDDVATQPRNASACRTSCAHATPEIGITHDVNMLHGGAVVEGPDQTRMLDDTGRRASIWSRCAC